MPSRVRGESGDDNASARSGTVEKLVRQVQNVTRNHKEMLSSAGCSRLESSTTVVLFNAGHMQ